MCLVLPVDHVLIGRQERPIKMNSPFSFSKYSGTAAACAWTLGWALIAICAMNSAKAPGNSIVPVAATLFGAFTTYGTFPRTGPSTANAPDIEPSPPEPWYRRLGGWFAILVWCGVGAIWNLAIFSTAIRAAAQGQSLTMVILIPFSLIGGFLLLILFTAIGILLDFIFQIKDETAPRTVQGTAPARVPPISAQVPAPETAPANLLKTSTASTSSLFKNSPIWGTLASIAFINWFVFAGISIHLGGDAIGTLPSQDGFILTSHGRHTAVSESTWGFSLYYSTATLLLTPAIIALAIGRFWWVHRKEVDAGWFKVAWLKKLAVILFVTVWCIGWYGSIGHSFLKSRADWIYLKAHPAASHR